MKRKTRRQLEEELCLFRSAYDRLDGMLQGILYAMKNDPAKGEKLLEQTRVNISKRMEEIKKKGEDSAN